MSFVMTAGGVSDDIGAAVLLDDVPNAQWLLAERGYDGSDLFEERRQQMDRHAREPIRL